MMIQERSASKHGGKPNPDDDDDGSPKHGGRQHLPTHLRSYRFSHAKSLDFATWAGANLYKLVAFGVLFATVIIFFLIRNAGSGAALVCFENKAISSMDVARIPYPRIAWEKIPPIAPVAGPTAAFRAEKWIVVLVSANIPADDPTLRRLARIKGWQLLAIGDADTADGWELKGAIFLSLEEQAKLGFRVVDQLPYRSYVRKSVGYLFAIQHGAKKIFDTDGRGDVIGDDLARVFDVDLIGESTVLQHSILHQYSFHDPNRTVVNPYIHFGQRSVWPRGLPLENVAEIGHEEFYTDVLGGKQFIQQGLSNGLPDVDSVFYFTRKSKLDSFDIKFDEEAPKVVLPQGTMVPVNSFNTLFHTQAFWGLMLPVSVSTMASDILRGYWAQRLLWEIGGYVTVYPPTVNRPDRSESYPFAEEKDLHVNVGRLNKFLMSWRSNKHTFFDKILHLSHTMAEEGFWTEHDVKFTAYWLQDLLAVGYKQPRLMSLEIDLPRATIGHGDRKEFNPRKLPSVHLGVEETGAVNFEIGNLIRWRKHFGNVVLIMYCSGPPDRTALEWRLLYGRIFKTVVILSEQSNGDLAVEHGDMYQAYKYMPKVFGRFPNAEGFLFLQDKMILNYWNLLHADKEKLWITDKVPESWVTISLDGKSTEWLKQQGQLVKRLVGNLPVHFQVSYKKSMKDDMFVVCTGNIFYVPRHFMGDFTDLVDLSVDLNIHHKVALPIFFMAMDSSRNFDSKALGSIIYKTDLPSNTSCYYSAEAPAVYPCSVRNEADFIKLIRNMSYGDPLLAELV